MKTFFREFFTFSPREVRAVYVLTIILVIVIMIRFYTDRIMPPRFHPTQEELAEIEDFIKAFDKGTAGIGRSSYDSLRYFDPNRISEEEMKKMGFQSRIIKNISRYRKAGGRFRKAGDIRKIYGMTDSVFSLISPYIEIRDSVMSPLKLDLNKADSAALVSLHGIGPVFAARIIKFRNMLGGFYDPSQLLEVYGIDSQLFLMVRDRIYTDTSVIKKIDLNKVTEKELSRHPYVGRNNADAIISYRELRGQISNIEELGTLNIIETGELKKIRHYSQVAGK